VFSLLGMWRNELGNLISVPQESMQKRFVWIEIEIERSGWTLYVSTYYPTFILLPKPFFPKSKLEEPCK
jgi:hypothetical protein